MFARLILAVVLVASSTAGAAAQAEVEAIKRWLKAYDEAFVAKDLERLATFYHPDVTI